MRTTQGITRAKCALCDAAERGVEFTPEALKAYMQSQETLNGVNVLQLEETPPVVPGMSKFSFATVGSGVVRAIGFLRRKPDANAASAKIARSKRRGSLMGGLTEEADGLGEMTEVDRMLMKDR